MNMNFPASRAASSLMGLMLAAALHLPAGAAPSEESVKALYRAYGEEYRAGNLAGAASLLEKALGEAVEVYGKDALETALYYSELGSLSTSLGRHDRAMEYHTAALSIRRQRLGDDHPDTAASWSNVGLAFYHRGDYTGAAERYLKALDIYSVKPPENLLAVAVVSFNLGRALEGAGEYGKAVSRMEEALKGAQAHAPDNASFIALCRSGLGSAYRSLGRYDASETQYREALALLAGKGSEFAQGAAEARSGLGLTLYHRGNYDGALAYYEKALDYYAAAYGKEHAYCANLYSSMGDALRSKGEYDRAAEHYERSIAIYTRDYGAEHPVTAGVYVNLGEVYRARGDTERAVEYHRSALEIYRKSLGAGHVHTATAHMYLGGAYKSMGNFDQAIAHYNESLRIYLDALGPEHSYVATAYTNLGGACEPAGEYDLAAEYYGKALQLYLKSFGKNHPHTAVVYNNLGLVEFRKGRFEAARERYGAALEIHRATLGEYHPYTAIAYTNLGLASAGMGDPAAAMEYYRRAEAVFAASGYRAELIGLKEHMALLEKKRGDIDAAAARYREAVGLVLKYRLELGRGKTAFMSRYMSVFNGLVDIRMGKKDFAGAFAADCAGKGLSIAEGLSLRDALARGGVSPVERKRFLAMHEKIETLQSRHAVLARENGHAAAGVLRELWRAEKERDAFNASLLKRRPAYAAMAAPSAPSAEKIRKALRDDEMMIQYSLGKDRIAAFTVTKKDGLRSFDIEGKPGALETRVRNYHTLLKNPVRDADEYRKVTLPDGETLLLDARDRGGRYEFKDNAAYRLVRDASGEGEYRRERAGILAGSARGEEARRLRGELEAQIHSLLLAPALRGAPGVKRLVIVPDGILYYLPFTLLRDGSGRRVLETHDCRLAHSATVWMGLRAPKMRGKRYPLLAFGNAVYSEGHGRGTRGPAMKRSRQAGDGGSLRLENLPGTEAELREIAALAYASPADRAVHCLGGVDASEDALFGLKERDALKKYRAVHFAVHGLLDDDAPALNALVLTRPESAAKFSPEKYARYVSARGAPRRDGYLRLGEVKTLALQSELVVMSACETSLGRLSAGEGMVALPQAFLLAGARSVMASLWAVDDESTTALMGEFYRNYLMRGLPPSEALRRAQEALRAEYDDPYYWAAFMVYGK